MLNQIGAVATALKMKKIVMGALCLSVVMCLMLLCACSGQSDQSSNAASSNSSPASSESSNASNSNATSNVSTVGNLHVNENTGRTDKPAEYTPGTVDGDCYVNSPMGIKIKIPSNFEPKPMEKENQELNLVDDKDKMKLVAAYATDGVLDDFITATYLHMKQQENPAYDYKADLVDLEIAGQMRHVVTTQMTHGGETSATAMVFFENSGHIMSVAATTPNVDTSIGLLSLIEAL